MSKVDVVPRTGAAAPVPSLESAMAAAVAVATTAATTATTVPTTTNSTISARTLPTIPTAATTTTITTTDGLQQPLLSILAKNIPVPHPPTRTNGTKRPRPSDYRESRIAKSRQRPVSSKNMEPPVLSFYGTQPVPLPSRFASLKKRLVAGHEAALEASWTRLIIALRDEIKYIDERRTELIPSIDFTDINDTAKVAPFESSLKRHGIGVIRGVVPPEDAGSWVEETKKYLETKHDFKPPPAQDPTCFDFFWTPAQVRSRAHPNTLQAQRFAMSLWNCNDDDRLATRFPITYADRIRIESTNNGIITVNGVAAAPVSPEDSLIAAAAAASNASIAQVDNGSLERWELDGYGRCGLYDEIFKGNWEAYNAWDPAGRVNATSDLYNGAGACSMMRMFQGILALTVVEPGMIRLLPSPKLSTVYFLLRPFFSPKEPAPESSDGPEKWEKYLDPSNWSFDREQTTIIHGAVPGHAQRVTAAWHPHLQLDKSLVTPPTLQAGDYIIWHPDQAYQFSNTNYRGGDATQSDTPRTELSGSHTSMLVYSPAAPLTQTNALFLARQRKAFLRGHPGPDFDSTGTGLGSEAPHTGRLGEKEIREVGGEEGLRAMGLSPWTLSRGGGKPSSSSVPSDETSKSSSPTEKDVEMEDGGGGTDSPASSSSRAETEVVRLANIILFPDRYDFYMPTRASSPVPAAREKEKDGGDTNTTPAGKEKGNKERDVTTPTTTSSSSYTSTPNQTRREKER
ncbi:hypothetical protein FHL15_009279 [Xylaria flabelliformis]|uniref:DUF1479 domain protein n=1 Tax=Xylaria flabelliformis TaxID=2512241 RepID=A0A553HPG6_9PEZI|nr:hypothetical protein FHL15_009279 [Xylaria flabelliformis]